MKNRLLILEMQDGMMCKNDKNTVKMMIDKAIENKPDNMDMVFKWQLYTKIKTIVEVIALKHEIFEYAYEYAQSLGFESAASVFDRENLKYIKQFNVPFVKIACKTNLYDFRKDMWALIGQEEYDYDRHIISVENNYDYDYMHNIGRLLCCVPKYPARLKEYEIFGDRLFSGISDHTTGLVLYNKYKPKIYEKHYYVDGLESWDKKWAIKPEELNLL